MSAMLRKEVNSFEDSMKRLTSRLEVIDGRLQKLEVTKPKPKPVAAAAPAEAAAPVAPPAPGLSGRAPRPKTIDDTPTAAPVATPVATPVAAPVATPEPAAPASTPAPGPSMRPPRPKPVDAAPAEESATAVDRELPGPSMRPARPKRAGDAPTEESAAKLTVSPAWEIEDTDSLSLSCSEVERRLAEFLAANPYLEPAGNDSGHPLHFWVRRCRGAINAGKDAEASSCYARIQRGFQASQEELKASFERFDIDDDGQLDEEEFGFMCAFLTLGEDEAASLFGATDASKDKKVSLEEFQTQVGIMGGLRKLFDNKRKRVAECQWGVHHAERPSMGNRVRAHFYTEGKKSKGWREAQIIATGVKDKCKDAPTDGVRVSFGFEDECDWIAQQVIPPSWVVSGSDDSQVAQALRECGILDEQQGFWSSIFPEHELRAMARLSECQRDALKAVRLQATKLHAEAIPTVLEKFQKLGFGQKELQACFNWIEDLAPTIVHVHIDRVARFMEVDDYYRNQFETGTSCGALDDKNEIRIGWEKELFGGCYDKAKPFERCKYGALSVMNDYRGVTSASQYGDSYIVLKNVRLRTTFAATDSGGIAGSRLGVLDKYAHVLKEYNDRELKGLIKVAMAATSAMPNAGLNPQLLRGTTVDSTKEWVTLGFPDLKQASGCFYYEVSLEQGCQSPQVGILSDEFQRTPKIQSAQGVGDDAYGWSVDGLHAAKWHGAVIRAWEQTWPNEGNTLSEAIVVGVAVDLDSRQLWFSTNGAWDEKPTFDSTLIPSASWAASGPSFYPAISLQGNGAFNFGPKFDYGPPGNAGKTFGKWPETPDGPLMVTTPLVGNSDILSCYKECQYHGEVNLNRNVQRLVANTKYQQMPKSSRSWSLSVAGAGICSGTYKRAGAVGDYSIYETEEGATIKFDPKTQCWQMHEPKEAEKVFASVPCVEGSFQPPRKGWKMPDEVLGVVNSDFFKKALTAKGVSKADINKLSKVLEGADFDGNNMVYKVRGKTSLADEWEKLSNAPCTADDAWSAAVASMQSKLLKDSGFAKGMVIDSGHPYPSKRHEWTKDVFIKGADKMSVTFASKTRTLDYRTALTISAGSISRETAGPGTRVQIQSLGGRYNTEYMRGHIMKKVYANKPGEGLHINAVIDTQDLQNSYSYQTMVAADQDEGDEEDKDAADDGKEKKTEKKKKKKPEYVCICVSERKKVEAKYEDGKKISDEISGFALDKSNPLAPISIAGFSGTGPAQAEGVQEGWFLDVAKLLESSAGNTLRELEGDDLGSPPYDVRSAFCQMDQFMKRLDKFRECSDVSLPFTDGLEAKLMPCARVTYEGDAKVGDEIEGFSNYGAVCINSFKQKVQDDSDEEEEKEEEGEEGAEDKEKEKKEEGEGEEKVEKKEDENGKEEKEKREVVRYAQDAGVRAGWALDIQATIEANESKALTEESIKKDPSSLLEMSDVTLVLEPSNAYDVSYFSCNGGKEYNPDAWSDLTIPKNFCTFMFHSDGDSTDSPDRRWGVFALVLPSDVKVDKDAVDKLAEEWSAVSSKAQGADPDGVSLEPADWDEQRLKALCKKRNWEFDWMSVDGERKRRIGEKKTKALVDPGRQTYDKAIPDGVKSATNFMMDRKKANKFFGMAKDGLNKLFKK